MGTGGKTVKDCLLQDFRTCWSPRLHHDNSITLEGWMIIKCPASEKAMLCCSIRTYEEKTDSEEEDSNGRYAKAVRIDLPAQVPSRNDAGRGVSGWTRMQQTTCASQAPDIHSLITNAHLFAYLLLLPPFIRLSFYNGKSSQFTRGNSPLHHRVL
jgi:hypothetical protein